MALTPAYLTSVATFYDMFKTVPEPVATTCTCARTSRARCGAPTSSRGDARAPPRGPRTSTCARSSASGACDIAPMASVNGEYVGPLTTEDAGQIVEDLAPGGRCSSTSSSATAAAPTPGVAEGAGDFGPPAEPTRRGADTAGLPARASRTGPGPTAAIEQPVDEAEGSEDDSEDPVRRHRRAGAEHARGLRAPRRLRGAAPRRWRMSPRGRARPDHDLGHPRPRRRRLPDGQEGLLPAPRQHGQVPRLQRRRVRAGHVQGPRAHAEEPAHADRGDHHRHLRGGDQPRVHLHPRRVRATGRHPGGGDRRGGAGRATRRADPRLRPLARASCCTAAPAPTSAARRRACSTRWRASAATRG